MTNKARAKCETNDISFISTFVVFFLFIEVLKANVRYKYARNTQVEECPDHNVLELSAALNPDILESIWFLVVEE